MTTDHGIEARRRGRGPSNDRRRALLACAAALAVVAGLAVPAVASAQASPGAAQVPSTTSPPAAPRSTSATSPVAGPGSPTAEVTPADLVTGQAFVVRGSGFPPGSQVKVAVCSFAPAPSGTGCADALAATADVSLSGELAVRAPAARPSHPCPCTVRLSTIDNPLGVNVPITLDGVAGPSSAQILAQASRSHGEVQISDVRLDGAGPWTTWFGAAPERVLTFSVRNTGPITIDNPALLLSSAKAGGPGQPLSAPQVGKLAPGQTRTFRIPVRFANFAFGTYQVTGYITGLTSPVQFGATTSSYPWGLLALIAGLAATMAGQVRRAVRYRRAAASRLALPRPILALNAGTPALGAGPVARRTHGRRSGGRRDEAPSPIEALLVEMLTDALPGVTRALAQEAGTGAAHDALVARLADETATDIADGVGRVHTLTGVERAVISGQLRNELTRFLSAQVPAPPPSQARTNCN